MDQAADNPNAPLFSQVQFYIVQSKGLTADVERDLAEVLKKNGAIEHCPSSNHANIPFRGLTHIISATIDFEGYEKAEDAFIPVVNAGWVESSIAKKKLANPRSHSPDPRLYFSGLVVTTADLPEGDKDAIIGGTLAMGGLYSSAVTRTVTHIVALTMDPNPCQIAVAKSLKCKIVLPHWFDDCLRLGKRIDEGPYTLPNPEIMTKAITDRIPDTARPDLQGAISAHVGRLPTPAGSPTPERRELNVFKDKTVMLARDLEIATHLRETVEDLVQNGGGSITTDVHKSDIYVCQYREGHEYQTASWEGKVVGNLPWLFHLISHNVWTSPLRRLLHYPIVRGGLPGLKKVRISLSNYNGEARIYLENLARAAGCEFTKTMKQDNTHLITAHMISEKCEAAKEWNINIINHLWLEESYAKWQVQVLTNSRYTHFPPRTNLSEVVGQVPIDRQALERIFFPRSTKKGQDGPEEQVDAPLPMRQADANVSKNRVSNSSAVQPPSSSHDALPVNRTKHADAPTPKTLRKEPHRSSDGVPVKTPARLGADGKENETPSTTGSRSAKDRAVAKLHNLAPDIALYEKEKKRVGGVIFGGRRKGDADRIDPSRKRSASVASDESDVDAEEEPKPAKRAKKGKAPPQMRLLITGYGKWANNHKLEVEDKSRLRDLGILITNDATSCTHLAAPKILRTQKFLCAMAHAPTVLSTAFLDDCLARQKLLKPDTYLLADPEGESRLDVSLAEVAARAKANKGRLLQGQSIYCTEHVFGGFDSYKSIIEANGGKCLLYRARAGSIPGKARRDGESVEEEEEEPEYVYLISGPKPEEKRLWGKFRSMVQVVGKVPRIVKTDWMLDLALRQEGRWRVEYDMAAAEGDEGEA